MNAPPPPPLYAAWLRTQRASVAEIGNVQARKRAALTLAGTLRRIARSSSASSPQAPIAPAQAARAELAIPGRYHLSERAESPHPSLFDVIRDWIADRVRAFFDALSKRIAFGPHARATFGDGLTVVLVLLAAFAFAQLLRGLNIVSERSEALLEPIDSRRSAQVFFVRAGAAAEAGDYSGAIRLLFAATVTLLELRGIVRDDASSTVNELRDALRARRGGVEQPFDDIAQSFTKAAYAERPIERGDWLDAREAYHALAQSVSPT